MMIGFLAAAAVAALVSVEAAAADLSIEVHGIRSDDGRLYLAVHGPEERDSFPAATDVVKGFREPARAGTVRFVVHDLAPGRYAMTAFHDENDNGKLDTDERGIPSEGYAFGNDASAAFGPPSFDSAAVTVDGTSTVAVMTMQY